MTNFISPFSKILISIFLLASCGPSSNKQSDVKEKEPESSIDTNGTKTIESTKEEVKSEEEIPKIEAKFIINNTMDSDGNPNSDIAVIVNGKKTKIQSVFGSMNEIPKNEYANYQIPKNAISAYGGWWAGAGDYFYLIINEKSVSVFSGWQDEGQEDNGYHWKKFKEINL